MYLSSLSFFKVPAASVLISLSSLCFLPGTIVFITIQANPQRTLLPSPDSLMLLGFQKTDAEEPRLTVYVCPLGFSFWLTQCFPFLVFRVLEWAWDWFISHVFSIKTKRTSGIRKKRRQLKCNIIACLVFVIYSVIICEHLLGVSPHAAGHLRDKAKRKRKSWLLGSSNSNRRVRYLSLCLKCYAGRDWGNPKGNPFLTAGDDGGFSWNNKFMKQINMEPLLCVQLWPRHLRYLSEKKTHTKIPALIYLIVSI